jgi:putative PIN family toxin of toxin-antitoxin system
MRKSVFDCNVFVQAVAFPGAAYHCLSHVLQGPDRLLTSKYVLDEARYVLSMPWLQAKLPGITPKRVDALFHHLRRAAIYVEPVPKVFDFPPDPADAPYLDLAIHSAAFALVTRDREILRLAEPDYYLAQRLRERHPGLRLAIPERFLELSDIKPGVNELLQRRRALKR